MSYRSVPHQITKTADTGLKNSADLRILHRRWGNAVKTAPNEGEKNFVAAAGFETTNVYVPGVACFGKREWKTWPPLKHETGAPQNLPHLQ